MFHKWSFCSFFCKKRSKYTPIDDAEAATDSDSQYDDSIWNETIVVFDLPDIVANSPALNILEHIHAQAEERVRSGTWYCPVGPTPQGYSRFLITLQNTTREKEFDVLQDHLRRCRPPGDTPFTFQRMSIELVY
ncbi:hypothetical protein N8T08_001949 [Aspergillus melleus]|uniref:Uncharacterized protein n=1 Tax=Aspergillus melleus TaxID=138277 RepID=A0ACC3BA15_9EURO|nr:hypothetical protein N8T08_001949 [Aspergillus melleus]